MTWEDFYEKFYEWSESTQISRISNLTDFGSSSEVFDIALEFSDPKITTRFLKKAIKAGVKFSGEEIVNMIDNVTEEFIPTLVTSNSAPYTIDDLDYISSYISAELLKNVENASGIEYTDWNDFYEAYSSWTPEVVLERIGKLKTYGSSAEVVEVSTELIEENDVTNFIKRAVAAGVRFTPEEIVELSYSVDSAYVPELIKYNASPFTANELDDLSDNLSDEDVEKLIGTSGIRFSQWEDYYSHYDEWDEQTQVRRAKDIIDFGDDSEVSEVIQSFSDMECATSFAQLALKGGMKFPVSELKELIYCVDKSLHRELMEANSSPYTVDDLDYFYGIVEDKTLKQIAKRNKIKYTLPSEIEIQTAAPAPKLGFFGTLFAVIAGVDAISNHKKQHNGRCDGDCANCPPHYGYRYGRWYYGHGHIYGCEFGGNKGDGSL